jgi:hypothetical protein
VLHCGPKHAKRGEDDQRKNEAKAENHFFGLTRSPKATTSAGFWPAAILREQSNASKSVGTIILSPWCRRREGETEESYESKSNSWIEMQAHSLRGVTGKKRQTRTMAGCHENAKGLARMAGCHENGKELTHGCQRRRGSIAPVAPL